MTMQVHKKKYKGFTCTVCKEKDNIFSYINKLYCSDKCRYVAIKKRQGKTVIERSVLKTGEKESFPQFRLEKCGHIVALTFNPKNPRCRDSLKHVRCQNSKCRTRNLSTVDKRFEEGV